MYKYETHMHTKESSARSSASAADSRCARCGKPRVPDDDGERIQRIIVCPVCEFQNDESVGFCGGCGYKLK